MATSVEDTTDDHDPDCPITPEAHAWLAKQGRDMSCLAAKRAARIDRAARAEVERRRAEQRVR